MASLKYNYDFPENASEVERYPTLYLHEQAAKAMYRDGMRVGDTGTVTFRVRVSSISEHRSGEDTNVSLELELLEGDWGDAPALSPESKLASGMGQ